MLYEDRKNLAELLAARNTWRDTYRQTDKGVKAASNPTHGWGGGRQPKADVRDAEWTALIGENGNAHIELADAERAIASLAVKAMADHTQTSRSELTRFLGYDFDEKTPWNGPTPPSLPDPVEGERIPILPYEVAGAYVQARGAQIARSISAFESSDVLLRAGFHPQAFSDRPGQYRVPCMAWQLTTGEWVGVDGVSVGYGGTGCGFAQRALEDAGIDNQAAQDIVAYRFCDVRELHTPDPVWDTSVIWPMEPRCVPSLTDDGRLVVHVGERLESIATERAFDLEQPDPDPTGFYPSTHPVDGVTAWLDFLDQPRADLPLWARGERTLTVLHDDDTAESLGFVLEAPDWGINRGHRSFPQIVITQGQVEIWGHFYQKDALRPLDPEVQKLAAEAGFTGQLPYITGQPLTVLERLTRFFSPSFKRTGVLKVVLSQED